MRSQIGTVLLLLILGLGLGYGVSFVYHPYKQKIEILNKEIQSLKYNLSNLSSAYSKLYNKYMSLDNNYRSLYEAYKQTEKSLDNARIQYQSLLTKYNQLKSQYAHLNQSYYTLQSEYTQLQDDYSQLLQKYSSLQRQYIELQSNYSRLQSEYNNLQEDYHSLQSEYSSLSSAYGNSRWYSAILIDYFNNQIRYALLEDSPEVFNQAISVVGHGWNPQTYSQDIHTINSYVRNLSENMYRPDPQWWHVLMNLYSRSGQKSLTIEYPWPYEPILKQPSDQYYYVNYTIYKASEFTFPPSYTLHYGGDCDDFATLQADLIEGYCQGNCDTGVYTLQIYKKDGSVVGHAVTFVKVHLNGQTKYMICDSTAALCTDPQDTEDAAINQFAGYYCNSGTVSKIVFFSRQTENDLVPIQLNREVSCNS